MDFPEFEAEAAFGANAFDASPSFSALPKLMKASIRHARQHSIGAFERAAGEFTFWNDDSALDPLNTVTVKPRKPFRLTATYDAVSYDVFRGFTGSVKPRWGASTPERYADITCADAFKLFNQRRLRLGQWPSWVPRYNPRFYYRMNDDGGATMKDYAPTPHDGTYVDRDKVNAPGPITTDADNDARGAMNCGTNDGAAVGDLLAGLDGTPFTGGVGIWLNMASLPASGQVYTLFTQFIDGGTGQLALRITDDGKFRVNELLDVWETGAAVVPADGAWHFVAFVRRGATVELWADGERHVNNLESTINYAQDVPHFGELTDGTNEMTGSLAEAVGWYASLPTIQDIPKLWHDVSFSASIVSLRTDEQLGQLLDDMGWPAGLRDIATGDHYAQKLSAPLDTSYLARMLLLDRTEGGLFHMKPDGEVRFTEERPTSAPGSSVTFGTGPGEIHYHVAPEAEYTDESQMLINEVTVTAPGVPDAFAFDQSSIDEFGPTGITQDTVMEFLADTQERAAAIVTRFAQPKVRIAKVVLDAADQAADNDVIPVMLGTQLGDTVTVKTPDGDAVVSQVVGIEHAIDMNGPTMRTTLSLEPW